MGPLSKLVDYFAFGKIVWKAGVPEFTRPSYRRDGKNSNPYRNTPNANMVDHSLGARDESNESEASQALMFSLHNAFPEKSCFVVDLVLLFRPPYTFLCS